MTSQRAFPLAETVHSLAFRRQKCVSQRSLLGKLVGVWLLLAVSCWPAVAGEVQVAFGQADITPDVSKKPVWIAGYGHGRRATAVHDPLMVRSFLVREGDRKIAMLSADLVGLQFPVTQRIRQQLADYEYVMVASTHNHEGPDVIGIWGPSPLRRGVDDQYLDDVIQRCVESVRSAERAWFTPAVEYGTAQDESLLRDSREPYVKDGILRALRFRRADGSLGGVVVQWNCHPETLGSRNTLLTADFPAFTVERLQATLDCPVFYVSGAVGGLMTNPSNRIRENGSMVEDGTFEYAKQYGHAVADLALTALRKMESINFSPIAAHWRPVAIPIENQVYKAARELGVLNRPARLWTGEAERVGEVPTSADSGKPLAVETEIAYLRFGELHVACIPGEVYPELVYGQFATDVAADFPDAPVEPHVSELFPNGKWLLIGLANDELGYIIPKRQWDEKSPFCFGRERAQYGEGNSCGPESAPILMGSLKRRVDESNSGKRQSSTRRNEEPRRD